MQNNAGLYTPNATEQEEYANHYLPRPYRIERIIKHTKDEWAFMVPG